MQDILIILACISLGMLAGVWQRSRPRLLRIADRVSLYAVYGLLFVLGAGLGADAELLAQLPLLGGRALCVAFLCTAGSVLAMLALRRAFPDPPEAVRQKGGRDVSPLKGSLRILCCFFLGILLGLSPIMPPWMNDSSLAAYVLYLLVFSVGIGLGADLRAFRIIRDLHVKILAVPLLIVCGSAAGAAAAGLILPGMPVSDAMCAGLGLGYYSLSSVLIENAGDSALASVALLANILREIMAILAAPLLASRCGRLSPVGAAGATAMDTTLPIIARFSGERFAVIAVFSGMTLTLLVPFLVTIALQLR
ncbi:lysine exporter LysO family protein [Desulfovibrio sp. OttesenSCG-928-A18]|nr:lysine exporter LysO family protein [Desulfovibrio sp. OttesenSCG-928-A18]